ncbi:hypothetical protein [Taibaiella koreensis]|uniref:hypothetical protein n=1 Tax=Taibaiella koreensis TaxID=1268548 RepID=UPI000E59D0B5|nr:hypothetical protein [Taibaiella koreensis]
MSDQEEMKQLGKGILKAAIGAVPVAGGLLNQLIFDVRGSVKRARYDKFIDALSDYMNSHFQVPLAIEQIEEEQVGDFFESVVLRVVKINAQKRIDALKRLLASQIVKPKNFDYAEVLAELIAGLSDYELVILQRIVEEGGEYADYYSDIHQIKRELEMLNSRKRERQSEIYDVEDSWINTPEDQQLQRLIEQEEDRLKKAEERIEPLKAAYNPSTYDLKSWELHLHLTRLVTKGIIQDESGRYGLEASTIISPNQVAYDIVDFLSDEN